MRIRSALVIANPLKKQALALKPQVERYLASRGIAIERDADFIITISGDGTILYTKQFYKKPFFGIGHKESFISQADERNWKRMLGRIIARGSSVERRLMLSGVLNGERFEDALNEICVRSRKHIVLSMELSVAGKRFSFSGDGIIFATPTGSTAYAYSCGGSEMPRDSRSYQIVPIAPYRRKFKPMITKQPATLRVACECPADLIVDGQFVHPLRRRSTLRIRIAKREMEFILPK